MIIQETERLIIRSWEPGDESFLQLMARDVGYNCFSSPGAFLLSSEVEATQKLKERMNLFEKTGSGKFPILLRATGEFIGTCGISLFAYQGQQEWELGYRLMLSHWGKGFATEAGKGVIEYSRSKTQTLYAFAVPQNKGSISIIEKLGFSNPTGFDFKGVFHQIYQRSSTAVKI